MYAQRGRRRHNWTYWLLKTTYKSEGLNGLPPDKMRSISFVQSDEFPFAPLISHHGKEPQSGQGASATECPVQRTHDGVNSNQFWRRHKDKDGAIKKNVCPTTKYGEGWRHSPQRQNSCSKCCDLREVTAHPYASSVGSKQHQAPHTQCNCGAQQELPTFLKLG